MGECLGCQAMHLKEMSVVRDYCSCEICVHFLASFQDQMQVLLVVLRHNLAFRGEVIRQRTTAKAMKGETRGPTRTYKNSQTPWDRKAQA